MIDDVSRFVGTHAIPWQAFNQHEFLKGGTQQQTEDLMLSTLKESISVPGQMICLLHPWDDPVPFRRVWCLFELYTAITLGAKIIMVSESVSRKRHRYPFAKSILLRSVSHATF